MAYSGPSAKLESVTGIQFFSLKKIMLSRPLILAELSIADSPTLISSQRQKYSLTSVEIVNIDLKYITAMKNLEVFKRVIFDPKCAKKLKKWMFFLNEQRYVANFLLKQF